MLDHIAEHPRCAIFAHMGSGKTAAVLHGLQGVGLLDEGPVLILAPKRVAAGTWPDQAAQWDSFDEEVIPILGTQTERFQAMGRRALFYSINYEQLPWLVKHHGRNWPYRTIVADKSTRLKGFRLRQGGQRTQMLGKAAWLPVVSRFVELTGTPAPNGLKDLWGQLWFLDRGKRLGNTFDAFRQRWFSRSWDGFGIEPLPHAQAQIQELISDICITIDPRDYMKIEAPIETEVFVDLPDAARDLYRKMERQMFFELEHDLGAHEIEAVNAASRTSKCLQLANGFVYDAERGAHAVHGAKIEALESIVEEANGMPVVVCYQFVEDAAMLRRAFPKAVGIDEIDMAEWGKGHYPMLIVHPASAGHGIDGLQYGTNIWVDFSSGWNLEHDDQAIERIGPMRQFQAGFDRPVYRYRIMARDTVDEMVRDRRTSKRSVQAILLDAMKRRAT